MNGPGIPNSSDKVTMSAGYYKLKLLEITKH